MLSLIKVVLSIFSVGSCFGQLLVTLPNGQILGHQLETFTGRPYQAFQAIPYATPPLGPLRFQAPEPAQNWTGVLNATGDANYCFQLNSDSPKENEDCLFINVFTPVLDRDKDLTKLPVIFWIYGGGLRGGGALFQQYRPDYWMDEDVILVTHNYRVGIFGFLSTGDSVIPGNNGLKDQALALKWTYDNIHLFGGDRDMITVHGQSAGAVSSSYHLLIEQSKGLFRSVIAESGTPLNIYSFLENPREYALQLTQAINSSISSNASSTEIRDFLLSLEARVIDSFSEAPEIVQPAVVLEPEGPRAVVTKAMYERLDAGDFYRVPILMGMCSEEGLGVAKSNPTKLGAGYDANPALVVPGNFPRNDTIDKETIGKAVKRVYLNESELWSDHPGRVVRHFSDQRFTRAIIKQGKLISQYASVYFYQFSYDGPVGGWNIVVEDAERVEHGEELRYVFLNRSVSEISETDALTHKRLVRLWSNFVKYQHPTPEPDDLLGNVTWPTVSPTKYRYLNINVTLEVETDPKKDYFSKWEQVFDTYGQHPFYTY